MLAEVAARQPLARLVPVTACKVVRNWYLEQSVQFVRRQRVGLPPIDDERAAPDAEDAPELGQRRGELLGVVKRTDRDDEILRLVGKAKVVEAPQDADELGMIRASCIEHRRHHRLDVVTCLLEHVDPLDVRSAAEGRRGIARARRDVDPRAPGVSAGNQLEAVEELVNRGVESVQRHARTDALEHERGIPAERHSRPLSHVGRGCTRPVEELSRGHNHNPPGGGARSVLGRPLASRAVAALPLKQLVLRAARTGLGRRAIQFVIRNDPSVAMEPLGQVFNRPATFGSVRTWPDAVEGFDDLAFLFSSSTLNNGIADLAFDEAAYLYRLVRGLHNATIVEIGRFKGGSAFVIAAAMQSGSQLWTYDIHVKLADVYDGRQLDAELEAALRRYRLHDRVHIVVADSRTVHPPGRCALVFVDGDHRYEGVRADYEHWRSAVEPGGHLLFHDAGATRAFAPTYPDVARLVAEIDADDLEFERVGAVGSLVHFRRRVS